MRDLGGKRLCRAVTTNADGAVKAWTATDPDTGRLYVYLVNKSGVARLAAVSAGVGSSSSPAATVSRITDPQGCSGKATGIDGAQMPAGGTFGWTGRPTSTVAPGDVYDVQLEPCQSAVLELSPSGDKR